MKHVCSTDIITHICREVSSPITSANIKFKKNFVFPPSSTVGLLQYYHRQQPSASQGCQTLQLNFHLSFFFVVVDANGVGEVRIVLKMRSACDIYNCRLDFHENESFGH